MTASKLFVSVVLYLRRIKMKLFIDRTQDLQRAAGR